MIFLTLTEVVPSPNGITEDRHKRVAIAADKIERVYPLRSEKAGARLVLTSGANLEVLEAPDSFDRLEARAREGCDFPDLEW